MQPRLSRRLCHFLLSCPEAYITGVVSAASPAIRAFAHGRHPASVQLLSIPCRAHRPVASRPVYAARRRPRRRSLSPHPLFVFVCFSVPSLARSNVMFDRCNPQQHVPSVARSSREPMGPPLPRPVGACVEGQENEKKPPLVMVSAVPAPSLMPSPVSDAKISCRCRPAPVHRPLPWMLSAAMPYETSLSPTSHGSSANSTFSKPAGRSFLSAILPICAWQR